MKTQDIKWQDLTKVLKVGDTVYSKIHGVGVVTSLNDNTKYPIDTNFNGDLDSFTKHGFLRTTDKYPCITNIPFDPLKDPFPLPRFEPIVGEVYAFFDQQDLSCGYRAGWLKKFENDRPYKFYDEDGSYWMFCLPIEQAHAKYLDFLNTKNSNNEKATKTI